MKWMSTNELRETFLKFFESKEHMRLNSYPLIPRDDDSLLLINSGMAPMKKFFTGEVTPPSKRVTTCQKCIRTPDIERVGITARHGTFFEMLGNFSFGDYFKKDAIKWSHEFFVKVLEIPEDRLWYTVYKGDDEAYDIWTKEVGIAPERVVRMDRDTNFWEHGKGPCGPSSEIYYDRGEQYSCGSSACGVGCECDRYIEIWNLVFTQFDNDGKGNYTDLVHPNIDTGMGLERLACVMQDVDNLFMIDTMQSIMDKISDISGVKYAQSEHSDISLRIITDHIRSTTFMIADGIIPSNEGRGYVLRRLLRRASRHGKLLNIDYLFLSQVCDIVIEENKASYPELEEKKDYIKKLISVEEENFAHTIDQGIQILSAIMDDMEKKDKDVISGKEAFKLNDTYGFPLDLTKEIIAEKGMSVDEAEFERLLSDQRTRARNARKKSGDTTWVKDKLDLAFIPKTRFVGYDKTGEKCRIIAILKDAQRIERAIPGDEVAVVLDKTPFYAEGGGQVGDTGHIENATSRMMILDTIKEQNGHYLHYGKVLFGSFLCDDEVFAIVDDVRRLDIMRNHTAAHLLQATLKKVLGNHVEQAGQHVDENVVRFDFTHFSAMTDEEIKKVEKIITNEILKAVWVKVEELPLEKAKQRGAIALFGEKYEDTVRVVSLEDGFSMELCGGTHVRNTARLGLFKIISESSIASGVRRIEAVTGVGATKYIGDRLDLIEETASRIKLNNLSELPDHCANLVKELKEKEKVIEKLNLQLAQAQTQTLLAGAKNVGQIKVLSKRLTNMDTNTLRTLCDKLRENNTDLIAVFANVNNGKATIAASVGKDCIVKGISAGKLAKQVSMITGGNGGGRPEFAMAGVKDMGEIDKALGEVENIVKDMLSQTL